MKGIYCKNNVKNFKHWFEISHISHRFTSSQLTTSSPNPSSSDIWFGDWRRRQLIGRTLLRGRTSRCSWWEGCTEPEILETYTQFGDYELAMSRWNKCKQEYQIVRQILTSLSVVNMECKGVEGETEDSITLSGFQYTIHSVIVHEIIHFYCAIRHKCHWIRFDCRKSTKIKQLDRLFKSRKEWNKRMRQKERDSYLFIYIFQSRPSTESYPRRGTTLFPSSTPYAGITRTPSAHRSKTGATARVSQGPEFPSKRGQWKGLVGGCW